MTGTPRKHNWRWIRYVLWVATGTIFLAIIAVVIFFGSGAANPMLRRLVVLEIENRTGTHAELEKISIRWWSLRITLHHLVVHGREPEGVPPLFASEEIQAKLRIESLWQHKVSLTDLSIREPQVHIRIGSTGQSNLPPPRAIPTKKSLRETLFELHTRHIRLEDGWLLYNDIRTPLALEGGDLALQMDAAGSLDRPLYFGTVKCDSLSFTARRFLPVPANVSAKFTLWREGFTVEQALLSSAHSRLDVHAEMQNFVQPRWSFRYRGWVNLLDLRETFRSVQVPTGLVDVRGEGTYADGKLLDKGDYSGREITLNYPPIFHASGVSSRASYRMDNQGIDVFPFSAQAFEGTVTGKIWIRFTGLQFRAETHVQNTRLAQVLSGIDHRGFPVDKLHWDALMTADTTESWSGPFKHFEINTKMQWAAPETPAPGHTPVTGNWDFRYRYDTQSVDIVSGAFETPSSNGTISGLLAPHATGLDFHFSTEDVAQYADFIHSIQNSEPGSPMDTAEIAGRARWDGKITGASGNPDFTGHLQGKNDRYDGFTFDSLDADIAFSPSVFRLTHGRVRHGALTTSIEVQLSLTDWSFLPENDWSADASVEGVPLDAVQHLWAQKYPVHGTLTGQFHGRGTRAEPELNGFFDLADGNVEGVPFTLLRGKLNVSPQQAQITDAELRLFPPGSEAQGGAGIVTGSVGYRFDDQTISADLAGASLPVADLTTGRSTKFPLGGRVSFHLKASGPLKAPAGQGNFRAVDFRVGDTVIGSFDGVLTSDSRVAKIELSSAMSAGEISGSYTLGLAAPYPLSGSITFKNISLDPLLVAALHLQSFDGHSKADGQTSVKGTLNDWRSIEVEANFSRLTFDYQNVQLENSGPVHFRSSREKLEIDSATFHGPGTNLQMQGSVNFAGTRALNLKLNGDMDLRLLAGFAQGLTTGGEAKVDAIFQGSLDRPRITGSIHIEKAMARVSSFPTGLSSINGDFVFDANHLYFENVSAKVGGGTLRLSGTVSYTERPIRYDISARAENTRILYPQGMSWLTAGTLRLTGTSTSALLSGRVTIEHVNLIQGLEVAGVFVSSNTEGITGPTTTSPFLRNLQLDVEAVSAPDARVEWTGAELEAEASLRMRGTWEHPILLGNIHVLSGDLLFHGNRYKVERGDINFANPFRIDPAINFEATTTVQQYEITLDFSGTASKMSLSYRSDPPMPSNDIVTLLALGQPGSESLVRSSGTTQQASSTAGASALLSEAVSSQVGGRMEKLFGITSFRVNPGLTTVGSTGTEQNALARVTVEQQVTPDLTVTYTSNVGSQQEQVIQMEYHVTRTISVIALRDYNGTFGIDIKFTKRLK